jgi:hypothetical protein
MNRCVLVLGAQILFQVEEQKSENVIFEKNCLKTAPQDPSASKVPRVSSRSKIIACNEKPFLQDPYNQEGPTQFYSQIFIRNLWTSIGGRKTIIWRFVADSRREGKK